MSPPSSSMENLPLLSLSTTAAMKSVRRYQPTFVSLVSPKLLFSERSQRPILRKRKSNPRSWMISWARRVQPLAILVPRTMLRMFSLRKFALEMESQRVSIERKWKSSGQAKVVSIRRPQVLDPIFAIVSERPFEDKYGKVSFYKV